jgi:mannitol-1-/sugar-/sorbitol-6-phosphatase
MILRASALLFDNDGVLVDSHAAVNVAWGILAEEFGLKNFSISNHYGTRAQDLILELVGEAKFEQANNRINELEQATADQTHALPGAVELLHSLPAGIWTICTSANSNLGRARIKAAGLPLPEQFVSGDDVEHGKPAPDPYLLGAKRLGFDAGECIVFEDADAGVKAALAAGAAFVVGVSAQALATDADIVVEDLAGISFDGKQLVIPEEKILRR